MKRKHEVIDLLLALRREGISCTTVSAGGVTLDGVIDMKATAPAKATPDAPRETMYERYGAELLRQPAAKASETVPEEAMIE